MKREDVKMARNLFRFIGLSALQAGIPHKVLLIRLIQFLLH